MARQRPTRLVMGPCIVEIDRIVIRKVQYQLEATLGGRGLCGRGAPGLVMGPCIVEIDCIEIREVQYQFEVNRCRIKEIIVKGNFGWSWPMCAGRPRINRIVIREAIFSGRGLCGRGAPGLVMGPCIVEIDRIVIREVQNEEIIFQGSNSGQDGRTDGRTAEITTISPRFSKCVGIKTILGGCGLLWAGRPRIDRIVIRDVQYQFEVYRCRNEEIIVKAILGWHGLCGRGALGLVMGPCIVEINCFVIREVQYQFEVNRCRNEEIIVKGNLRWAWPMWAWPRWANRPRNDRIVIREVQYQFEVNRCRTEEIIVKGNFGCAWPMWAWHIRPGRPRIDRIVIIEAQYQFKVNRCRNEEVNFQGSSAYSVGGLGGQDGRTDAHHHNIPTFSPKNVGIKTERHALGKVHIQ
ncbi:hypothetical protein DPMN_010628 [Dreissena polymorpha]|uniref:Uncharacterized protein n=1 Tax=Dreissena polymorpha TaxID=45954 RepID=A0A9D4N4J7_DREPO|nr:hypothetical protein DPMN_010628 [Dreissena polymorpha]